jgi:hypothetical protein
VYVIEKYRWIHREKNEEIWKEYARTMWLH